MYAYYQKKRPCDVRLREPRRGAVNDAVTKVSVCIGQSRVNEYCVDQHRSSRLVLASPIPAGVHATARHQFSRISTSDYSTSL
jgi:hypothetical protein